MGSQLELQIITPDKVAERCPVDQVILPGTEGQFCVLPGHAALLSSLEVGELQFSSGQKRTYYAINQGYVEVFKNKVTVLVETAERAEEIDKERAWRAKVRAEEQLARLTKDEKDYVKARAALMRAIYRLKVADRK